MPIHIKQFSGIAPVIAPTELGNSNAQIAQNCRFHMADLRSWDGNLLVTALSKAGVIQSIYRFNADYAGDDKFWFQWTTDVDVVRGQIAGDTTERTYWTGDGVPKVTDSSMATLGAGTAYPNNSYTLGVPRPTLAAMVAVAGVADTSGLQENRVYVYTWVTGWGEEGVPSPASSVLTVASGQSVNLSSMDLVPAGAYNIQTRRIYRSTSAGNYQFVAEIPAAQTTYSDTKLATQLGEVLPSLTNEMPPANMFGLTAMANGIMAGFSGSDICFSDSYRPYSWPSKYKLSVPAKIIGGGAFGQNLLVCTDKFPYMVSGTDPGSMSDLPLDGFPQACVSKRSIVAMENGVIYASPDGLCLVTSNGANVMTQGIFSRDTWQKYNPSSIHAYGWDGRYIGFYDTGTVQGGFIFDPRDQRSPFITLDFFATGGYTDLRKDALFLAIGTNIYKFSGDSANPRTYLWHSKKFVENYPKSYARAQVMASAYPVTFRLFMDGALWYEAVVNDNDPFTLPDGTKSQFYEIELTGTGPVFQVDVGESIADLKNV